jgi:hypothetical protein
MCFSDWLFSRFTSLRDPGQEVEPVHHNFLMIITINHQMVSWHVLFYPDESWMDIAGEICWRVFYKGLLMPSHLLGPLILLWPITEVYRGFVALQALRLSPYLLSDTVSNSLSLQTGGSGNIATINQQRQTGNTSASFPAQPLSMSGGMTGGGGWSTMGGRLGPLPDSVLRLAGTSHLLRAASWELYGR